MRIVSIRENGGNKLIAAHHVLNSKKFKTQVGTTIFFDYNPITNQLHEYNRYMGIITRNVTDYKQALKYILNKQ